MGDIQFTGIKKIPLISKDFFISLKGILTYKNKIIDLKKFNLITNLNISSIDVLKYISFRKFYLPPIYWKHLKVLRGSDKIDTPESLEIGLIAPIESLEYKDFYIIPYFSNYLISKYGILLKKSNSSYISASKNIYGYYTYRMTNDLNKTQNFLRHRIMALAFLDYPYEFENMVVNHKNGIPGDDVLENLQWSTYSENILHAYEYGLRTDNQPVEIYDTINKRLYIYSSISSASKAFGISDMTMAKRARTNGYKSFSGLQIRFKCNDVWPKIESEPGNYLIEMPNGIKFYCGALEASRYSGLTKSSFLRMIRNGRSIGKNNVKITRINGPIK